MTDHPKVSVLIPCFNAEKYIGETLESVFQQTWPNLEIVVVDDGSTDNSGSVISQFVGSKLRVIRTTNRGQTAALNVCLTVATGEFVQYLDADDLIAPDKIALQMRRLDNNPRCIASAEWGRFRKVPAETQFNPEVVWGDLDPLDWLAASRAEGLGMMFPALWLIPMSLVQIAGPWNEELTLNNDAEYFTRILLACERVLFCSGARCHYRSGIPGSLSGQKSSRAWHSQYRVIELCETYVRAREDSERVRRGFALSWQHFAHAVYPYDRAIGDRAIARAQALHPVTIRPRGGLTFHIVSRLIGWRAARRLQVASGRS